MGKKVLKLKGRTPTPLTPTVRIQLLSYPKFQLTLLGINLGVMTVAMSFVAFQLHRAMSNLKAMGVAAKIPTTHAYFRFLDWQTGQFYSYLGFAFGMAFFISAIVTLVMSNRVVGPMTRLKRYFDKIGTEGFENEKIQFRRGDFFSDLPPSINKAMKRTYHKPKKAA